MDKIKIAFIDDEENILNSFKRIFRKDNYELFLTTDPNELFDKIKNKEFHVVVSDQRMPKMDGVEVLKTVNELAPDTTRIMLTGYADISAAVKAINEGSIYRFLSKPWNEDTLKGAIQQAIDFCNIKRKNKDLTALTIIQNNQLKELNKNLEKKVEERTNSIFNLNKKLELAFLDSIKLIGSLSDLVNLEFNGHAKRVAQISGAIAKKFGMKEREIFEVQAAAFMHDIGKIGLLDKNKDDSIHISRSYQIIKQIPALKNAADYILYHHENVDGTGVYKLFEQAIPLGALILKVVDNYDYELNDKYISEVKTPIKVIQNMSEFIGIKYSSKILTALKEHLTENNLLNNDAHELELDLYELREGMILSRILKSKSGKILLGADFKVTKDILMRIWKFHKEDPLSEKVHIYIKTAIAA